MTSLFSSRADRDAAATLTAISKSQAMIEFALDGTILTANENFLGAMGYTLAEIQGQHHRMFVEPTYAQSAEYADFWRRLGPVSYTHLTLPTIYSV